MSSLWDNAFEKQKSVKLDGSLQICNRCKLPYPKSSEHCDHCANVEDDKLEQLRKEYNQQHNRKEIQKRIALVWSVILILILLVIFMIAT